MEDMKNTLDELINQIKASDTYKTYEMQKQKLKQNPELKQKVDEYREQEYMFQQRSSGDEIFEEADRHLRRMEEICEIPGVREFLNAEVAYCRMVQKVQDYILNALAVDFD